MIEFDYTDAKGKHSHRHFWVLSAPSDSYYGYDLTEFDPDEREVYMEALEELMSDFYRGVSELGLKHNFRRFKEERVELVSDEDTSSE